MSLELTKKEQARSDCLFQQVHKHLSFNNKSQAGSGIAKYRSAMKAFCDFTAKNFRLQNLNNISNKHLAAFAQHRQEIGIKDVKTEVSAVRKFHSRLDKPRYQLETDNKKLGIDERKAIQDGKNIVDRAWTENEFRDACTVAREYGHEDIATCLEIARHGGLRINEVTALTKSQIRHALKETRFTVTHAKGGLKRDSNVETHEYRQSLKNALNNATSERVFLKNGLSHKQMKDRIQNFIYNHREKWSDISQENQRNVDNKDFRERENLNFHGLRHSFAREQYRKNLNSGMTEKEARKDVAHRLGHGRDEVTKVYL